MTFVSANNHLSKPSVKNILQNNRRHDEDLGPEVRKHWDICSHCSTQLFTFSYPEFCFSTQSCNFYYQLYCCEAVPDQELVKLVRQAYYKVLAKLNQREDQVKNFVLPVFLMKLKYIDPYSRQRIIEELCNYLSSQTESRTVVLEQAEVTFSDLCRLLGSLACNTHVRRLYLWNVLGKCQSPFKGPLEGDVDLDNLPRVPYTYNPGGRKYLKNLEKIKLEEKFKGDRNQSMLHQSMFRKGRSMNCRTLRQSEVLSHSEWMESLQQSGMDGVLTRTSALENYDRLLTLLSLPGNTGNRVISQQEVGLQCNMSICESNDPLKQNRNMSRALSRDKTTRLVDAPTNDLFTTTINDHCQSYLKKYENITIRPKVLREIYTVALNRLYNLTTLSINYGLLADGTGETLMSIGSVIRGKLKDLELLCQMEELPSPAHQQYNNDALHAIPDVTWKHVKNICPDLKVHLVCVYMSCYDVTKKFITKSIPLNSLFIDNGFCPTLVKPQITFFSTLKCLHLNFNQTLKHVTIVLWHSSGRIDIPLERFVREMQHLHSFEYFGPLQFKNTIHKLCEAALRPASELVNFKLMVEGDPCYPHVARNLTSELYQKYQPAFLQRSIKFMLGAHHL